VRRGGDDTVDVSGTVAPDLAPTEPEPGRPRRVTRGAVAAVLAVFCAMVVTVSLSVHFFGPRVDERPVTLPDTFAGRERVAADQDFGRSASWLTMAREAAGGAGVAGTAYGRTGRINVVALRGDATGVLDVSLAADYGDEYGGVRCTRKLGMPTKSGRAIGVYEKLLLCWRTSPTLSVSAFSLGATPEPEELAPAVQALWDSLRAGD
jgi:hypothetical protein